MKILITTDWYQPVINGVVTSVVNLAQGLRESGHEVRILTLSGTRHSYIQGDVTYIGSVGVGMVYPNARLRAVPASGYIHNLINWHPDIIHSQCEFSTFFLARKISEACHCPLVHTYHTVYENFTHYFSPSIRFGKYVAAKFSKRILSQVQAVIVPTEKIVKMLYRYGVKTPVYAIPSGLDLEQFRAKLSDTERDAARKKLGIANTDHVLIYLGRLAKEKNISELLELLSQRDESNLRLLLVGDGPYRETLEKETLSLGITNRVIFAGMVPPSEVARFYQLGDIFVSASQSETQGLTYIEAMAAGLPLLCKADPCLDGVIQNGFNGFTYTCEKQFQEKLDRLRSEEILRGQLGAAARKTAFDCYSANCFAARIEEIYCGLLQKETDHRSLAVELLGA